jgi:hypothetical protein
VGVCSLGRGVKKSVNMDQAHQHFSAFSHRHRRRALRVAVKRDRKVCRVSSRRRMQQRKWVDTSTLSLHQTCHLSHLPPARSIKKIFKKNPIFIFSTHPPSPEYVRRITAATRSMMRTTKRGTMRRRLRGGCTKETCRPRAHEEEDEEEAALTEQEVRQRNLASAIVPQLTGRRRRPRRRRPRACAKGTCRPRAHAPAVG